MVKLRGGPDAFYVDEEIPLIGREDVEGIKTHIPETRFGRTRMCVHGRAGDTLQEMFIVLPQPTYIRPHKHVGKMESLLVLEGTADAVFFDDDGAIVRIAALGEYRSGRSFFYRIGEGTYHTLIIRSEALVFKETTLGPFDSCKTVFAPWSPAAEHAEAVRAYIADLTHRVARKQVPS